MVTKLYPRCIKPQVVLEEYHSAHPGRELQIWSPAPGWKSAAWWLPCLSYPILSLRGVLHPGVYSIFPEQTRNSSHQSTKQVHQGTYQQETQTDTWVISLRCQIKKQGGWENIFQSIFFLPLFLSYFYTMISHFRLTAFIHSCIWISLIL